jgi:hypothetical protein
VTTKRLMRAAFGCGARVHTKMNSPRARRFCAGHAN